MTGMTDHTELILDGTKIAWHQERIRAWERGERIAPITIDMALTRACNFACHYCYAMLQENDRKVINKQVIFDFLEDCADIGVKGISFVSDGESTISPVFVPLPPRSSARFFARCASSKQMQPSKRAGSPEAAAHATSWSMRRSACLFCAISDWYVQNMTPSPTSAGSSCPYGSLCSG